MDSNLLVWLITTIVATVAVFLLITNRIKSSSNLSGKTLDQITAPPQPPNASLDNPETASERTSRLKNRFTNSQAGINNSLRNLFTKTSLTETEWTELEEALIIADVGAKSAAEIIHKLKAAVRNLSSTSPNQLKDVVKSVLVEIVAGDYDRTLKISRKNDQPAVVLTVGVNGTGKTTTTGKMARMLVAKDLDVLLGAADTFRAAAAQQLTTWGDRVGVAVVRGIPESDPASVAFEAVSAGIESEVDVVLIDTAGRLHTKQGLMDELGKVHRVISKTTTVDEVLLVIDATTGQNGLNQAKLFSEVVPLTGIVLTKLDGTAKGGIVIAVQNELGIPVKLVGLGEGPDDLALFDPILFVEGLVN